MKFKERNNVLLVIFITFFKIGGFTFGGGFAMIPLIEKEVVTKKNWIDVEDIVDVFAVAQSIPEAIAINSATLIGYKISGKKGALAATLGVILPSFSIILIIAAFFSRFQDNTIVQNLFKGIRPCIVALVGTATVRIAKKSVRDTATLLITISAFVLTLFFDIHVIWVIIGGAVTGIILGKLYPERVYTADNKEKESVR